MPIVHAVPMSAFQLGPDMAVVLVDRGQNVFELDLFTARVLASCQGAKSLAEHAANCRRHGLSQDQRAIDSALDRLVGFHLLRHVDTPGIGPEVRSPHLDPIGMVALITADRPAYLDRCLKSLGNNCRAFDRRPVVTVIDGSVDAGNRIANRSATVQRGTALGMHISYVGRGEALALVEVLTTAGHSRTTLEWALATGTTGANRNLALLLTGGGPLLMIDDDIICTPWTPRGYGNDLRVVGHTEVRSARFFETRAEALAAVGNNTLSLLDAHERLLGQSVGGAGPKNLAPLNLSDACGHVIGALLTGEPLVVRTTSAGIAGDSGTWCPYRLLFASGAMQAELAASEAVFQRALRSREVHRVATTPLASHDATCMAYCMAVDTHGVCPPFSPIGRNQDGLFGNMLSVIDPTALFGHLAAGVMHDSARPSDYSFREIPSASQVRFADLLSSFLRRVPQAMLPNEPERRLQRVGTYVSDLAAITTDEFAMLSSRFTLEDRCRELTSLEATMALDGYPSFWRTAAEDYRRQVRKSIGLPAFFLPLEFSRVESVGSAFAEVQRSFGVFGHLIQTWPEIVRTTRDRIGRLGLPWT